MAKDVAKVAKDDGHTRRPGGQAEREGRILTQDNIKLVRKFCEAVGRMNADKILEFFTEDAVYHNIPVAPAEGEEAIRSVIEIFLKPSQAVESDILNISASGQVVLTERLDKFSMGRRRVELPVAGVFEVRDGKISAWRDYFDLATWMKQTVAR